MQLFNADILTSSKKNVTVCFYQIRKPSFSAVWAATEPGISLLAFKSRALAAYRLWTGWIFSHVLGEILTFWFIDLVDFDVLENFFYIFCIIFWLNIWKNSKTSKKSVEVFRRRGYLEIKVLIYENLSRDRTRMVGSGPSHILERRNPRLQDIHHVMSI